jgi:hypothetical protein
MTARPAYQLRCSGLSDRVITPLVQTELRRARWWIRFTDPHVPVDIEARLHKFWYGGHHMCRLPLDEALAMFERALAVPPARLPTDRPWTMVRDGSLLKLSSAAYAGPDLATMIDVVIGAPDFRGAFVVAGWLREAPADVPWQVMLPIAPEPDRGPVALTVRLPFAPYALYDRLRSIAHPYARNSLSPLVAMADISGRPRSIAEFPTRPDGHLVENILCETLAGLAPLALEGDDEDCEAIMRWVRVAWQHVRPLLPHLRLWTIDAPWTMRS